MSIDNQEISIHPLIAARRSIRAFAPTTIAPAVLNQLFEAARWAPSSSNVQPWQYIYANQQQPDAFQKLLDCLNPSNQVWAQKASVLAVSLALKFNPNGAVNKYAFHDVGAASALLSLQAATVGLSVHQMGGYSPEKIIAAFNLPPEVEPVSMMAIGYPGNIAELPEVLQLRETATRERKPVESFVFNGEYKIF